MSAAATVPLEEVMAPKRGSIDPSKHPGEEFDLYSIPAFDAGVPDVLAGNEIGSAKQLVAPGDVLLSRIVPHIRRSWVVGGNRGRRILASGEWIVFRSKTVDSRYLRHVLVGDPFHAEFMRTVSGVGGSLLRARPAYVAKIRIPLPPLPEQRRIAKILDKADAMRAKRHSALVQLDALTQSIFTDMFGDPMLNPMHWEIRQLKDVVTRITDGTHKTPAYTSSGIEFLSAKDLKDGGIAWGSGKFISEPEHRDLSKRCRPELGDILLAKSGSLGNVAIVNRSHEFSLFESLCLIKHDRTRVNEQYLTGLLRNPSMLASLLGKNKGVAIKHLHLVDVRSLAIPLPPLELQLEFARRVGLTENLKATFRAHASTLNALFASCQQRAFRGEL